MPCKLPNYGWVMMLLCVGLPSTSGHADSGDWANVSTSTRSSDSRRSGRNDLSLSLSAGMGQLNSNVPRTLHEGLSFNPTATGIYELAIGTLDSGSSRKANINSLRLAFLPSERLQGSLSIFGMSSIDRYCDVEGCGSGGSLPNGFELTPLNLKFLASRERGYFIFRPTLANQGQIYALRFGPMAGAGYGVRPNTRTTLSVPFAGFNAGLDGKICSSWFFSGAYTFRIQSGISLDIYEDLTGHLGQVAADGVINNDTMTGLAYFELIARTGRTDEWALGWKGVFDRLSPYDPTAQKAASNQDTAISIYLRWSGSPNLGSPATLRGA